MRREITDRLLKSLSSNKTDSAPQEVWDQKLRGFGCRVSKRGTVSFFAMRRQRGTGKAQAIRMPLGRYPLITLANARQRARTVLRDLYDGIDPRQQEAERLRNEAAKQTNTFNAVAETFITRHVARARTARAIELRIRRELVSRWGDRPIAEITRADVVSMIDEIVDRGTHEAARQTFAYARRLFRWAVGRAVYSLEHAPTDHLNARDLIGVKKPRQRVLREQELQLIWRATESGHYPNHAFVRLLLLLGVRRSELARATWDEFDLNRAGWVIPAGRTKNAESHLVPLSPLAIEMLRALPRLSSGFVFTARGTKPLNDFSTVKRLLDRRIAELNGGAPIEPWTFHDARRTFRTGLSTLGIAPHIAELCIGHKQRGIIGVYDLHRFDAEKRHAFNAWTARLLNIIAPPEVKVIPLVR